ncbi:hypothetical protein DIPPA_00457 [Diplonema papillatum]|nr:hypothetical protein DIPPA_00457 [Diplonema papillatum]
MDVRRLGSSETLKNAHLKLAERNREIRSLLAGAPVRRPAASVPAAAARSSFWPSSASAAADSSAPRVWLLRHARADAAGSDVSSSRVPSEAGTGAPLPSERTAAFTGSSTSPRASRPSAPGDQPAASPKRVAFANDNDSQHHHPYDRAEDSGGTDWPRYRVVPSRTAPRDDVRQRSAYGQLCDLGVTGMRPGAVSSTLRVGLPRVALVEEAERPRRAWDPHPAHAPPPPSEEEESIAESGTPPPRQHPARRAGAHSTSQVQLSTASLSTANRSSSPCTTDSQSSGLTGRAGGAPAPRMAAANLPATRGRNPASPLALCAANQAGRTDAKSLYEKRLDSLRASRLFRSGGDRNASGDRSPSPIPRTQAVEDSVRLDTEDRAFGDFVNGLHDGPHV